MTHKLVLSERKTKSVAALAGITLDKINKNAGLGIGYISRKWGSEDVQLATINRIANAIGCAPLDLLEELREAAPPPVSSAPDVARQQQRPDWAAHRPHPHTIGSGAASGIAAAGSRPQGEIT